MDAKALQGLQDRIATGVRRHQKTVPYDRAEEFLGTAEVHLRTLGGNQRDAHEAGRTDIRFTFRPGQKEPEASGKPTLVGTRARFAAMVLGDKDNNQIYDWEDTATLAEIGEWPQNILDDIYEKGLAHNGMKEESVAVAAKN